MINAVQSYITNYPVLQNSINSNKQNTQHPTFKGEGREILSWSLLVAYSAFGLMCAAMPFNQVFGAIACSHLGIPNKFAGGIGPLAFFASIPIYIAINEIIDRTGKHN